MEHSRDISEKYYERIKVDNTSQELYPNDRKLGKEEGEDFIYVIIDYRVEGTYVEEMYSFFDGNYVMEVEYAGHEDNEIYPKYQKFLKKMKFEGLKDIELEYAEPQS